MPDPSATCASTWSASTRKNCFFKYSAQLFQSLPQWEGVGRRTSFCWWPRLSRYLCYWQPFEKPVSSWSFTEEHNLKVVNIWNSHKYKTSQCRLSVGQTQAKHQQILRSLTNTTRTVAVYLLLLITSEYLKHVQSTELVLLILNPHTEMQDSSQEWILEQDQEQARAEQDQCWSFTTCRRPGAPSPRPSNAITTPSTSSSWWSIFVIIVLSIFVILKSIIQNHYDQSHYNSPNQYSIIVKKKIVIIIIKIIR